MDLDKFLEEDVGNGDVTCNLILSGEEVCANVISKERCIISGIREVIPFMEGYGISVTTPFSDGEWVDENTVVLELTGPSEQILTLERLVLNTISRMSGIATMTRELVDACEKKNPKLQVAATRKTTPGFRRFEKQAVVDGGGIPHRFGLFDAVLIKDNHIKIVGGVEEALDKVSTSGGGEEALSLRDVEIDVENQDDAVKVARRGVGTIMLDNMSHDETKDAYNAIKSMDDSIIVEVSGGITRDNITDYAPFADRISLGMLTHSYSSCDFTLKIESVK